MPSTSPSLWDRWVRHPRAAPGSLGVLAVLFLVMTATVVALLTQSALQRLPDPDAALAWDIAWQNTLLVGPALLLVFLLLAWSVHQLLQSQQRLAQKPPSALPAVDAQATAQLNTSRLTEAHEQTRQAEQADRRKTEFLAAVTHELRTPMNAIMGFNQLLLTEPLSPDQQECVQEIETASKRMLSLINELLDLNKIESGQVDLDLQALDLAKPVEGCIRQLAPLAAQRGIQIRVHASEAQVLADEQRLQQVLVNLLSNAIKYNRDQGKVDITVAPQADGRVRLAVRDTGIGIPAAQQPRIFAPFERGAAKHSDIEGTGIGLTITRRLVHRMKGEIGFESTEGVGTEFWVLLPGTSAPPLPTPADSKPSQLARTTEPTDPNALIALTYVSAAVKPLTPAEREALLQEAKAFNATVGVTGMLLYHDGNFFQYLEGPASGVKQVMERVRRSTRHHHLTLQTREPIAQRQFADWNMDFVDLAMPRVLKNAYWIQTFRQAWSTGASDAKGATENKGIRLLLNFVAQMTGSRQV